MNSTLDLRRVMIREFPDKSKMEDAWVDEFNHIYDDGKGDGFDAVEDRKCTARIGVRGRAVYVPHIYRGGWVIRGFGYSVERIGKYIDADHAGDPLLV